MDGRCDHGAADTAACVACLEARCAAAQARIQVLGDELAEARGQRDDAIRTREEGWTEQAKDARRAVELYDRAVAATGTLDRLRAKNHALAEERDALSTSLRRLDAEHSDALNLLGHAKAQVETSRARAMEAESALAALRDPVAVRANVLRGTIVVPDDLVWLHDTDGPVAAACELARRKEHGRCVDRAVEIITELAGCSSSRLIEEMELVL